jgi:hypothetical protein
MVSRGRTGHGHRTPNAAQAGCIDRAGDFTMSVYLPPTDPYHIQAVSGAAALPKLVLKHEESFVVCDRAGDFPAHFDGELGFYHEGTRRRPPRTNAS